MENKNKIITIVAQAFYGNRVMTDVEIDDLDYFILGHLDNSRKLYSFEKLDRTVVPIPNSNLVIVYNKYQEESQLELDAEVFKGRENEAPAAAIIPEIGFKIYSRCIVCRMNKDGSFDSINDDDYNIAIKYLMA